MRTTRQLSITLPDELADAVKEKVASGEYATESEVIRDGLRALMARDRAVDDWLRGVVGPLLFEMLPERRIRCRQGGHREAGPGVRGRRAQKGYVQGVKSHTVGFTPESEDQLAELYNYIATQASPEVAYEYTEAVIAFCEGLGQFPGRGTPRDDIRPAMRVTNYRRRTVVAYAIQGDRVSILGVFYGGQDYESALRQHPED